VSEIDFMEYSSDANAQAAYVTNASVGESVDQQQTTYDNDDAFGKGSTNQMHYGQSFQLSGTLVVTAVEVRRGGSTSGTPSGNWTFRIETDNSGVPSGTLADANASIVVTPPAENTVIKGTFATPFSLNASTLYWLVITCPDQATNVYWTLSSKLNAYGYYGAYWYTVGGWTGGWGWNRYFKVYVQSYSLQSYSEATIKTQGSYSLKAVATTGALNKTLTKTF